MARLAESSVVIAFRDWQWKARLAKEQYPEFLISLEGNAESYAGDLKLQFGELLYLFEVKSTAKTINEEWNKRASIVKRREVKFKDTGLEETVPVTSTATKPNPKRAFLRLAKKLNETKYPSRAMAKGASKYRSIDVNFPREALQSLMCHHLLYWSVEDSNFAIKPYILGIRDEGGFIDGPLKEMGFKDTELEDIQGYLNTHTLGYLRDSSETDSDGVKVLPAPYLSPGMLLTNQGKVVKSFETPRGVSYYSLETGLELEEFQVYVDWLCEGVSQEMHALVMSDKGTIFQEVFHTDQLREMIRAYRNGPDPMAEPERSGVTELEVRPIGEVIPEASIGRSRVRRRM